MIGRAEQILPGGDALVRVDDGVVLVRNGVPGDLLKLRELDRRRGARRAEIIEILEQSKLRVTPACPVADRCGGCALQPVSGSDQADLKSTWVSDAFQDLIEADCQWMPAENCDYRRRRLRWFVGRDDIGAFLGFRAPASHQVVRHATCIAVTEELDGLRGWLEENLELDGVDSIQAVHLHDGVHIVIESASTPQFDFDRFDSVQFDPDRLHPASPDIVRTDTNKLAQQWWWRDRHGITRPLHKPIIRFHDQLPAGDGEMQLMVGPDDFVQGVAAGNRAMIAQIQAWAGPVARVVDLFCGIGNLSLPLAVASGASVYGAELNAASVRAAANNASALAVAGRFVQANLFERGLFEAGGRRGADIVIDDFIGADLLLLDPPRRGAREICRQMGRLMPRKVIMVSCDPASGARDGAILKAQGYHLKALWAMDLFPCAGHVETISLWQPV